MIGLPGRSRTCILRVRNTALVRLSYGKKLAPVAGFEPAAVRLTVGCTHPVRLTGMIGGASGNRTQHVILARDNSAPAAAPNWCPASDSNRPVCDFGAAQSPDLLTGHLVRTTRVELVSPRWRRGILPLNYVRADGGQPANRTWLSRRFYRPAQSPDLTLPIWRKVAVSIRSGCAARSLSRRCRTPVRLAFRVGGG
jgi:hypothetical protein